MNNQAGVSRSYQAGDGTAWHLDHKSIELRGRVPAEK